MCLNGVFGVVNKENGFEVAVRSQEGDGYIQTDTDIDVQIYMSLFPYPHVYMHTYDNMELVVNYYWFKTWD